MNQAQDNPQRAGIGDAAIAHHGERDDGYGQPDEGRYAPIKA